MISETFMRIVNQRDVPEERYASPGGKFESSYREISLALGREPESTDALQRHPFDVSFERIAPGKSSCPYHSHSAQWEFYSVVTGRGRVRHSGGESEITQGDAFVFKPGEAHQLFAADDCELSIIIVADNPVGETCYYPDSKKWLVRSPLHRVIRSEPLDYLDGEE